MKAKFLTMAMLGLALSGCVTSSLPGLSNPTPYDGKWLGQARLSIGDNECLRRVHLNARIINGSVNGAVVVRGDRRDFQGTLKDDGEVDELKILHQSSFYNYNLTGQFEKTKASGEWKSRTCRGTWSMRKVG